MSQCYIAGKDFINHLAESFSCYHTQWDWDYNHRLPCQHYITLMSSNVLNINLRLMEILLMRNQKSRMINFIFFSFNKSSHINESHNPLMTRPASQLPGRILTCLRYSEHRSDYSIHSTESSKQIGPWNLAACFCHRTHGVRSLNIELKKSSVTPIFRCLFGAVEQCCTFF